MQETKEKWGLALEGGGARGAYQVGAYKALLEMGYRFDAIAGTSIGAVNGAAFAQNAVETAENIWLNLSNSALFGVDEETYESILSMDFDGGLDKALDLLKGVVQKRGLSLAGMEKVLTENLSEEAIRTSPIDFGLVTLSLPDMTAHELFKDQIPAGKLLDFVMASANHPAFQRLSIDGKAYFDGGAYNNLPIDMLANRGCTNIVAVRIHGMGIIKKPRTQVPVLYIEPRESLGNVLDFDGNKAAYLIKLGYFDTLRTLQGLKGSRCYIRSAGEKTDLFLALSGETVGQMAEFLRVPSDKKGRRLLLEEVLPRVFRHLDMEDEADYDDLFFTLMERELDIPEEERFKIWNENEFVDFVQNAPRQEENARTGAFARRKNQALDLLRAELLEQYRSFYETTATGTI